LESRLAPEPQQEQALMRLSLLPELALEGLLSKRSERQTH
jgi:hypothetical protein